MESGMLVLKIQETYGQYDFEKIAILLLEMVVFTNFSCLVAAEALMHSADIATNNTLKRVIFSISICNGENEEGM
jgi:hypothetical protein